ncbi:hypothetical protein [Tropicibacter sp. S64]|uniref:hypothetical protein n=1 Tax=Tropicibacter sp. S64 TaxID=3415122 RepID=UPI003C7BF794
MSLRKVCLLGMAIVSLSACSQTAGVPEASRNDTPFLVEPVALTSPRERAVTNTAIALEDSIRAILRNASAPAGACAGNLSDPGMALCSERDLMGRTLGALRDLTGGSQPFDRNALAPAISQALEDLAALDQDINTMLREQGEEMAMLQAGRKTGMYTETDQAARLTHMVRARGAIAETLSLSAARAAETRSVLEKAQRDSGEDYSWYVTRLADLERSISITVDRLDIG